MYYSEDSYSLGDVLNNLGAVYMDLNEFETAEKYLQEALKNDLNI